jgi:hypothetical protein
MPAAWEVVMFVPGAPPPPWQIRDEVARWLEGHSSGHDAPAYKSWAITSLEPGEAGLLRIVVGMAATSQPGCGEPEQYQRLWEGAARLAAKPAFIWGRQWEVVPQSSGEPVRLVEEVSWSQLRDQVTEVSRRLVMAFTTPTRFGDGNGALIPSATAVFGSLRRRWRQCGGSDEAPLDVDITRAGIRLEYDSTRIAEWKIRRHRGARESPSRIDPTEGFIGLASYVTSPADELGRAMCRGLEALAGVARFFGVGSHTTQGMGATRLIATARCSNPGECSILGEYGH